uniref:Uncharacterized protein n=1 Tax=Nonomuraea sp. MJM5123 TaxID=1562372 RepID=A0A1R7SQL3_9ACTN|nr:hypothetical protein [Nonomuraea sp. MJM5123]
MARGDLTGEEWSLIEPHPADVLPQVVNAVRDRDRRGPSGLQGAEASHVLRLQRVDTPNLDKKYTGMF